MSQPTADLPSILSTFPNTGVIGQGDTYGVIGGQTGNIKDKGQLLATFTNIGVWGTSYGQEQAGGVVGESDVGYGVYGVTNSGIGVSGGSQSKAGVFGESATAEGVFGYSGSAAGIRGESYSGPGVDGVGHGSVGGVFQSDSSAQLRLVPSSTPLQENQSLLNSGQVGELCLYSVGQELGKTGTSRYTTILWLCIAPAAPRKQSVWAQVQLGDTFGG